MHVIVIGAGIIGSTTALALTERGIDVTLLESKARPGLMTSYANGSSLTPGHAEPWNPPGTLRRMLPALVSDDQPWRIRARALPGLAAWGLRFLAESGASRYYANAGHCVRLGYYAQRCLADWRQRHGFDYHQHTRGSLELYFSEASLTDAITLRARIGEPEINYRRIDTAELVGMEPALRPVADRIHGTLLFPEHESGDAHRFSALAAGRAGELGAELRFEAPVEAIEVRSGSFRSIRVAGKSIPADACIVAAGCASPALLRPLGLNAPIYPVKGYSATIALEPGDPAPEMPLLDLERRFVTARLGPDRLRIAGLAEFAGFDGHVRRDRIQRLLDSATILLPDLTARIRSAAPNGWSGLRPMTPDGAPLIGPTPIKGLHLNSGHGAMGWTQACGSAELAADLVAGNRPAIDPGGLLANRYLATGSAALPVIGNRRGRN
jgi:D-amino-acid dehydrogenase